MKVMVIRGAFNKFSDLFRMGLQNYRRHLKILYVLVIHLMRWLTNFYDFRFKWTATEAIGIHPTKSWLSQLVIFKNAIWTWGHFRRTICNKKICFKLATETYGMLQTAFGTSCMNRASVLSGIRDLRKGGRSLWGMITGVGGVSKSYTRVYWTNC